MLFQRFLRVKADYNRGERINYSNVTVQLHVNCSCKTRFVREAEFSSGLLKGFRKFRLLRVIFVHFCVLKILSA